MKAHFYWPNMYNFVKNCVDKCNECVQRGGVVVGGFTKAVVVPTYEPKTPMEFLTIDFVCHLHLSTHMVLKVHEILPIFWH